MASDEAWSAGWNLGSGYAGQRFAQKQGRASEQWEDRRNEFNTTIDNLQKKYASALKTDEKGNTIETPASLQAKYALTQAIQARNTFQNPVKGPGLGEKIGAALHLTKKPQAQSFTTQTGGTGSPAALANPPAANDPRFAASAGAPASPGLRQRPGVAPVADAGVPIDLPEEPAYQQNAQATRQPATAGAGAASNEPTMKLTPGATEPGVENATLPALPTPAPALPSQTQTIKRPAYSSKQLRDMAQRSQQAQEETSLLTAAASNAPLTAEQAAVEKAQAGTAGNLATMKSSMTAFDALYPHATSEDRQEFQDKLMGKTFGTAAKPVAEKYMPQLTTTKDAQGKDHYWRVPLSPGDKPEEVDFNGETITPKATRPLSPGAQAFQAMVKKSSGQTLSPDEEAALKSYPAYINETSTAPRVAGYVAGAKARAEYQPTRVVNPDNPQEVITVTAGEARRGKYAMPASVGYQVNVSGHKAMIPSQMGTNLAALGTARGHLRLLGSLIDALGTGNYPMINSIGLAWSRATGDPAPSNFETVKASLQGELAKAYSGTSGTIPELAETGRLIDEAKSPQALRSALNYARDTMKVRETNLWATARMAGLSVPGKTTATPQAGGGGVSVTAPDGSIHTFKNKAAADQFKKAAGIR